MAKRTDIQDGITLMLISRIKSTFYKNEGGQVYDIEKIFVRSKY